MDEDSSQDILCLQTFRYRCACSYGIRSCERFLEALLSTVTDVVKLLPTAFGNLMDPCLPDLFTTNYPPMPGVIMMAALFCLFTIEMYLNHKMGGQGHSHGGPMGIETGPAPVPMNMRAPERPPRYGRASFETDEIEYEKQIAKKA